MIIAASHRADVQPFIAEPPEPALIVVIGAEPPYLVLTSTLDTRLSIESYSHVFTFIISPYRYFVLHHHHSETQKLWKLVLIAKGKQKKKTSNRVGNRIFLGLKPHINSLAATLIVLAK